MRIIEHPLPDFDERPANTNIQALVLHCSAHSAKEMIEVLRQKHLSCHYIIDTNGDIFQCVADEKRAWHAGVSQWRQMENMNHYSIGIELSSLSMGQNKYPLVQINSLISLANTLIKRYNIPNTNVVAHSDVAPQRKPDPGIMFPWKYLAKHQIGLWYDLESVKHEDETDIKTLLSAIGYDVSDISAASYAFCRHFLPHKVKKIANTNQLIKNVFPANFCLDAEDIPVLQAVRQAYR